MNNMQLTLQDSVHQEFELPVKNYCPTVTINCEFPSVTTVVKSVVMNEEGTEPHPDFVQKYEHISTQPINGNCPPHVTALINGLTPLLEAFLVADAAYKLTVQE